jgi:predicted nucleic acid-binding protein
VTAPGIELRLADLAGPVVIDASVAVEYLVSLPLTPWAQSIFRKTVGQDFELWAPDLIYAESVSALRRMVRLGAIRATAGETAVARLVQLPIATAATRDLMPEAWRLRDVITPYDACYAALAAVLEAPFVTADRALARALTARGKRAVFLGELS